MLSHSNCPLWNTHCSCMPGMGSLHSIIMVILLTTCCMSSYCFLLPLSYLSLYMNSSCGVLGQVMIITSGFQNVPSGVFFTWQLSSYLSRIRRKYAKSTWSLRKSSMMATSCYRKPSNHFSESKLRHGFSPMCPFS